MRSHGYCRDGKVSIYNIWAGIIQRCFSPKCRIYPHYGGRGISVCARWRKFENFIADMGERPGKMSIERINNDGNYEPDNCRWATQSEQCRNRRSNTLLTVDGETHCLAEWAELRGMNHTTIAQRIKYGWTVRDALFKPIDRRTWDVRSRNI